MEDRPLEWVAIESANIAAAAYDAEQWVLHMRFHKSAKVYQYQGVPAAVAEAFFAAPSKGSYHAQHIKWVYPWPV